MVSEILDKNQPFIFELEEILTPEECSEWIKLIKDAGPEPAPINTPKGTKIAEQIRNNRRAIFDNSEWADDLFQRIKDDVPQEIHGMKLCGANERLRCYEYFPGHYFAPHSDGAFFRDENEQSFYTYIVYLNDDFTGGETCFWVEPKITVKPKTGAGIFFQHPIIHESVEVKSGAKYVVRTDLMYRKGALKKN